MNTSSDPREHLCRALEADLVGPFDLEADHQAAEQEWLPLPPSRWYLTGFLAPDTDRELDEPEDDILGAGEDELAEDATAPEQPPVHRRSLLPSSLGLSVLLPPAPRDLPADQVDQVRVTLRCAQYRQDTATPEDAAHDGPPRKLWRRQPLGPWTLAVPLLADELQRGIEVPHLPGVSLQGRLQMLDETAMVPPGTRALSLFLVNRRPIETSREEAFLFQVRLELEYAAGFVPRPDMRGTQSLDWDERLADLQYRQHVKYAVGHGVSVEIPGRDAEEGEPVCRVATCWLPRARVWPMKTRSAEGVVVALDDLAQLRDSKAVHAALDALPAAYDAWIEAQGRQALDNAERRETRVHLMRDASRVCKRIREGIDLIATDAQVRQAFCLANEAVAQAMRRRRSGVPEWRLFQLAFILLNLPSVADVRHSDRRVVELIFFPTGGGKTEAYLGVIACQLLLRRLRGQQQPDRGLGVAVLLRYTLRLLTLDQLGRAATLICALERLRRRFVEQGRAELGHERFSIGLWVGRSATANRLQEAAQQISLYKNGRGPLPSPITACPWCGEAFTARSFLVDKQGNRHRGIRLHCVARECDFSARKSREGLPLLYVDEQIYRELPCFLVATVDKFAMLPWRAEVGRLFGRVDGFELGGDHGPIAFHGPGDRRPRSVQPLAAGLRPPELVVQDELHLISGPLGTMVGLYEGALEALMDKPKILASTATVRRAETQVQALFGRAATALFPPPGPDAGDTFFAYEDRASPGRLYLGLAAPGRAFKALLLRCYVALLGAGRKLHDPEAPADQMADAYQTLAGYFNSLRELGGMRRLVEDEIRSRCEHQEKRRPQNATDHRWVADRQLQAEPLELTSRASTASIADAKARLAQPHAEGHVDVVLASSMISVGVDIDRLGLMVIAGQPKTASEYIQASSRVGRDARWPGLVVTCFNLHRPRDRSHYERFSVYHQSFYRHVEAVSLTPGSAPALDRGLAAVLVGLARHWQPELTPNNGMMRLAEERAAADQAAELLADAAQRRLLQAAELPRQVASLRHRCGNLLDAWQQIALRAAKEGERCYSPYDDLRPGRPLLFTADDEEEALRRRYESDERKFRAPTSMRDVEPAVHLWLRQRLGGES